jgi:hypothetical protein
MATQELFDTKRYLLNFCDNLLLRAKDKDLETVLLPLKRDINSSMSQGRFLDGHKAAIISNIDKILSLVSSRYAQINFKTVEEIVKEGKQLIKKVLYADNFDQIAGLEPTFRGKVVLPTYSLFIESMKRSKVTVI